MLQFEVGGPPSASATNNSQTASEEAVGEPLSYEKLEESASNLVNAFQGSCSNCNLTIASVEITPPVAPPEEPGPRATPEEGSVVIPDGQLFSNVQQEKEQEKLDRSLKASEFAVPASLKLVQTVPREIKSFNTLPIELKVSALTAEGAVINSLGTSNYPWRITVTLQGGHTHARLLGSTTANYTNGSATFSDLYINGVGSGYILSFNIAYPDTAPAITTSMNDTFTVKPKAVSLDVTFVPEILRDNEIFNLSFSLIDVDTGYLFDPSLLQGHIAAGTIDFYNESNSRPLPGYRNFTLRNGELSNFSVEDLHLSEPGYFQYVVEVAVQPAGWNLVARGKSWK